MPDTRDLIQGAWVASANAVIGTLKAQPYPRRITNIVLRGPARSTFKMYRGTRIEPSLQMTATPTGGGADNTYDTTTDGASTMVGPGEEAIGVWTGGASASGSTGTATVVSVY